jgi:Fe-S-cluster formation regulator IscX/YfhJ
MITIQTFFGLCNQLRAAFSYWEYAKTQNKKLTVIWTISPECPGFFLDYFEPVKGITFLTDIGNLKLDYSGGCRRPESYSQFIFKDLHLKQELQQEVNKNLVNLGNDFIAIQVRRTDYESLAKQRNHFTSDKDFCKFLDENPDNNIFVSADNKESFDFFKQRYPQRVKNNFPDNDPKNVRHTSLKDSIICLYTCVYAKKFMPSDCSSFGETILEIRKNLH